MNNERALKLCLVVDIVVALWICISCNADPDPDPAFLPNADPDPGRTDSGKKHYLEL
jgi:hypothetical protein